MAERQGGEQRAHLEGMVYSCDAQVEKNTLRDWQVQEVEVTLECASWMQLEASILCRAAARPHLRLRDKRLLQPHPVGVAPQAVDGQLVVLGGPAVLQQRVPVVELLGARHPLVHPQRGLPTGHLRGQGEVAHIACVVGRTLCLVAVQ